MHGYSEWSSINIAQLPVAVAYPKSTEEVSRIAKVCHKYKVPMSTSFRLFRVELGADSSKFRTRAARVWKPTFPPRTGA